MIYEQYIIAHKKKMATNTASRIRIKYPPITHANNDAKYFIHEHKCLANFSSIFRIQSNLRKITRSESSTALVEMVDTTNKVEGEVG